MRTSTQPLKITRTTKVEVSASFRSKPIQGAVERLEQSVMFLIVNWEGEVMRVVSGDINQIHDSWFSPSDKAGLSIFGVNKEGKVVCGMAFYDYDDNGTRNPHYEVVACEKVQTHPWG